MLCLRSSVAISSIGYQYVWYNDTNQCRYFHCLSLRIVGWIIFMYCLLNFNSNNRYKQFVTTTTTSPWHITDTMLAPTFLNRVVALSLLWTLPICILCILIHVLVIVIYIWTNNLQFDVNNLLYLGHRSRCCDVIRYVSYIKDNYGYSQTGHCQLQWRTSLGKTQSLGLTHTIHVYEEVVINTVKGCSKKKCSDFDDISIGILSRRPYRLSANLSRT